MDVSEQGLSLLWLRVLWLNNRFQRQKVDKFFGEWIEQVKMTERALAESQKEQKSKRIRCR